MPGCSVNDVGKYFRLSRIAVMKHLQVLEDADLIISRQWAARGNCISTRYPSRSSRTAGTTDYTALWASHVTDIMSATEARKKETKPDVSYQQASISRQDERLDSRGPGNAHHSRRRKTG